MASWPLPLRLLTPVVRASPATTARDGEDFLHTCVPVAHADAVFLDGKTKRALLERMGTPAKVFSASEVNEALEFLDRYPPSVPPAP